MIVESLLLVMSLHSRMGTQDLWKVQFRSMGVQECGLQVLNNQKKLRKLSVGDCERLRALAFGAKAESKVPAPVTQGKNYLLTIDDRQAAVEIKAPEECELTPLGESNCKKNNLSKSQELALELLRYAPSHWND